MSISSVDASPEDRLPTGSPEFDRVLGGGIVPGSLVLVGGDPGIGKSTLLLQVSIRAAAGGRVLYVTGEESATQVRMRADRLGLPARPSPALPPDLFVMADTDITRIEAQISETDPVLVVVDSIQTVFDPGLSSAPGSVAQVRQCAAAFLRLSKERGIPVFLIGHVTKGGDIAGPRVLEHVVDTVLYFEGERYQAYRILRAVKNRFGSTNEIGIFEMRGDGLKDVANPSGVFLEERSRDGIGSVVAPCVEGTRPLLVEVQALVTPAVFGVARRTAIGVDHNRVCLIAAVLEKRAGLNLASQDIYVKVAGGLEAVEPAADLAVAVAVASSLRNRPVPGDAVMMGEVGLGGEVRAAGKAGLRVSEAVRLGFRRIVLPAGDLPSIEDVASLEKHGAVLAGARTVAEALDAAGL